MAQGLRYETGRDMPPGMLEKVAVKLVAELRKKVVAHPSAAGGRVSEGESKCSGRQETSLLSQAKFLSGTANGKDGKPWEE